MTTDDVKSAEILLDCKDGRKLIGKTNDEVLLKMIAAYVKFVELDKSKIVEVGIKEIIK